MDIDFDIGELSNLEQIFYDQGYKDGYDHGRVHGLIEGRALGREKGYQVWEEVGFYKGFALVWNAYYESKGDSSGRALHHVHQLLELIKEFPASNPPSPSTSASPSLSSQPIDIQKLLTLIRSRYKALCASLGVKPLLRAVGSEDDPLVPEPSMPNLGEDMDSHPSHTKRAKNTIWEVAPPSRQPQNAQSSTANFDF